MLKQVKKGQASDEIIVVDAGVKVRDLQKAKIENYEVRLAKNFTARRNYLPKYKGHGRKSTYGDLVRPLARTRKDKTIEATAPDEVISWEENDKKLQAKIWRSLVLSDVKPDKNNKTFDVYVIYDPDFDEPWVLATPVKLQASSVRAVYRDRWPVEQIPLSAKHMVGAHRQFVHAKESVQRLPELALLAGSILSFLAATLPAIPTGFWDRQPKRTPGRLRRVLMGKPFPKLDPLPEQLRKKELGHRPFAQGKSGSSALQSRFDTNLRDMKRLVGLQSTCSCVPGIPFRLLSFAFGLIFASFRRSI